MSDDVKVGDRVSWSSSGGKSVGRVKKKLTKPLEIKGHHVAASPDNPELLVQSEKGGEAAHKPASVHKVTGSPKAGSAGQSTAKKSSSKATSRKTGVKKSTTKKPTAKKSVSKKAAAKK